MEEARTTKGGGLPPRAYMFWYICVEGGATEYVYIIAFTEKQARYFFVQNGFTKMYDYSLSPVRVRATTKHYAVGEMLGQEAII